MKTTAIALLMRLFSSYGLILDAERVSRLERAAQQLLDEYPGETWKGLADGLVENLFDLEICPDAYTAHRGNPFELSIEYRLAPKQQHLFIAKTLTVLLQRHSFLSRKTAGELISDLLGSNSPYQLWTKLKGNVLLLGQGLTDETYSFTEIEAMTTEQKRSLRSLVTPADPPLEEEFLAEYPSETLETLQQKIFSAEIIYYLPGRFVYTSFVRTVARRLAHSADRCFEEIFTRNFPFHSDFPFRDIGSQESVSSLTEALTCRLDNLQSTRPQFPQTCNSCHYYNGSVDALKCAVHPSGPEETFCKDYKDS